MKTNQGAKAGRKRIRKEIIVRKGRERDRKIRREMKERGDMERGFWRKEIKTNRRHKGKG